MPVTVSPWLLPVLALALWAGQAKAFLLWMACLLLHELGHAGVCALLGQPPRRIRVLPFGCAAEVGQLPPLGEAAAAAAGPAVSLLLAMAAALAHRFGLPEVWARDVITCNLFLAGLNLLPGLPLDGGRMLRGLAAPRLGWAKATRIACLPGIAVGAGLLGLFAWGCFRGVYNVTLAGFGLFLAASALRERRVPAAMASGQGKGAMPVRHIAVPADSAPAALNAKWLPGCYHRVTLLDGAGMPLATLEQAELLSRLSRLPAGAPMARMLDQKRV